jgi:hypothetical protein
MARAITLKKTSAVPKAKGKTPAADWRLQKRPQARLTRGCFVCRV